MKRRLPKKARPPTLTERLWRLVGFLSALVTVAKLVRELAGIISVLLRQ